MNTPDRRALDEVVFEVLELTPTYGVGAGGWGAGGGL